MANHVPENERKYPDKSYDQSAFDRLYGDGSTFIMSNKQPVEKSMTIEERARYLYDHGYVDKDNVTLKQVIARLQHEEEAKDKQ
jgi:hypothetical protein